MRIPNDIDKRVLALVREKEPVKGGAVVVALEGERPPCGTYGHKDRETYERWNAGSRQTDAALQRLRKAGEIVASREGWRIAGTVPCAKCNGTGRVPC